MKKKQANQDNRDSWYLWYYEETVLKHPIQKYSHTQKMKKKQANQDNRDSWYLWYYEEIVLKHPIQKYSHTQKMKKNVYFNRTTTFSSNKQINNNSSTHCSTNWNQG